MTRGEFKQRLRRDLQLDPSVRLYLDTWSLDEMVKQAVDAIASECLCLYGVRTTGLVANQANYALPGFFDPRTAYVKDASGEWQPLEPIRGPSLKDRDTLVQWRNRVAEDGARQVVLVPNFATLYPTPTVDREAALAIEGYFKPGAYWTYDGNGNGVAIVDASECPLPSWAQEAAYLRAKAMAVESDERPQWAMRYERWRGEAELEADNVRGHAMRFGRHVTHYSILGPWCGGYG